MYPINSPNIPIVLGLPWLKIHSPSILWNQNSIQFESLFCKQNCLPRFATLNAVFSPPEDIDDSISEYSENQSSDSDEFYDTKSEQEVCQQIVTETKQTFKDSQVTPDASQTVTSILPPDPNKEDSLISTIPKEYLEYESVFSKKLANWYLKINYIQNIKTCEEDIPLEYKPVSGRPSVVSITKKGYLTEIQQNTLAKIKRNARKMRDKYLNGKKVLILGDEKYFPFSNPKISGNSGYYVSSNQDAP
ncbi:hypothetical protein BB559_000823 [Furculomyces boomerangus]|uniref:Uncharacterized protein n=1 Tax=Furculomyces boomerangus TaxID=61424 RepID=A0A2T9Z438_9FUNG|nr:hypothetical protein BB559_000823 [Furculomyces boomerangus]